MTADAASREDIRNTLAALIETAMVANAVDAVYSYEKESIEDKTAIMVLSAGTKRMRSGINDTRWKNQFLFDILVFVEKANTLSIESNYFNWTALDVENRLDRIDKALADVVADNRGNAAWSFLDFADEFSQIVDGQTRPYDPPEAQQTKYKIESFTLVVDYIETG